jgi:hypothetical protein
MNKSMLPKLKGQRVRIRPVARRFNEIGQELEETDDTWFVEEADQRGVSLRNDRTDHKLSLNPDNIVEYQTDPPEAKRGFLLLKTEVFLQGRRLWVEPRDPMGGPTRVPVPRVLPQLMLDFEEIEILVAAASDGFIPIMGADQVGDWVRAGSYDFYDLGDRAVAARYLSAVPSLVAKGLARSVGHRSFELTGKGFAAGRLLAVSWSVSIKFLMK